MDLEIKKAVIAPCPSQGGLQAKVWSRRRPLSASLILGACPLGNLLLFIMILRPLAYIRCPPYPHEASFLASLGPVKFCTHQISNPEYEQSPLRDEGPNFKNLFEDFWLCLYGVTGTNVALPPKSTRKMIIRLLCPWDSSGKNTRVVCHFFLQEIFLTQGSNSGLQHLLHCRRILYPLCHLVLAN